MLSVSERKRVTQYPTITVMPVKTEGAERAQYPTITVMPVKTEGAERAHVTAITWVTECRADDDKDSCEEYYPTLQDSISK